MNTLMQAPGSVNRAPRTVTVLRPVAGPGSDIKPLKSYSNRRRLAVLLWLVMAFSVAAMAGLAAMTVSTTKTKVITNGAPHVVTKTVAVGCG